VNRAGTDDSPATVNVLDLTALVPAPVTGEPPDTAAIDGDQYTGTIAWQTTDGAAFDSPAFAGSTVYQAALTLTAKTGWTFTGLAADSFTHDGAGLITNTADSGIVTITFPATAYLFTTGAEYRTMVQVNTANTTITGSGSDGVFIAGRNVTLSPYKMAKYETTWQLWKEVYEWALSNGYAFANTGTEGHGTNGTGTNTNEAERITRPVTNMSWRDAVVWCNAYSEISGLIPVYYTDDACTAVLRESTGAAGTTTPADKAVIKAGANGYRLPTEAQWEFAARGGNPANATHWSYPYAGGNVLADVAWCKYNAYAPDVPSTNPNYGAHPAGKKSGNRLDLFDMTGNVREWCWDWYNAVVSTGTVTDPPGPDKGTNTTRMAKGGRYMDNLDDAYTVFYRVLGSNVPNYKATSYGFRVVRGQGVNP
jgi:formylglycine-generating enzyme required for sulfatase activity